MPRSENRYKFSLGRSCEWSFRYKFSLGISCEWSFRYKFSLEISCEWSFRYKFCWEYHANDLSVTNFRWKYHVNDLSVNLRRANALLSKMRKYVSVKILRSIYFAIFGSHLSYSSLFWTQNCSSIQWIVILQKKAVRIINFRPRSTRNSPQFKQSFILKFQDKTW